MKIIKMRPSHQPVIRAMCRVFQPQSVIECGCGPNSTPIWSENCKHVIGIEHNVEWSLSLQPSVSKNVEFVNKDFYGVTFGMYPDTLIYNRRKEIYDWYVSLFTQPVLFGDYDLLFVDSYAGVRVYALMALAKQCGITMYHDTEVDRYWYRYFEARLDEYYPEGYKHFSYRPKVHVAHTFDAPHTEGFREIIRQEPCTDIIFRPEHYDRIGDFGMVLHEEHEKYYWKKADYEFVEVTK